MSNQKSYCQNNEIKKKKITKTQLSDPSTLMNHAGKSQKRTNSDFLLSPSFRSFIRWRIFAWSVAGFLLESLPVGVDVGLVGIGELSGAVDSVFEERSSLPLSWNTTRAWLINIRFQINNKKPNCLSAYLLVFGLSSICLWVVCHMSVYLSACLSVCLPVCLSACLPDCLLVCLSVCLLVCLLVCLPVSLSVCLSACLSIYLSTSLSLCLSIYIFALSSDLSKYSYNNENWDYWINK